MKTALITGITGQDGSYLAELLLQNRYEVHGIVRRASTINTARIDHLLEPTERITLHYGDLSDGFSNLLHELKPDEIYNLASMSHVRVSFDVPLYTLDINATGPARILEAIRRLNLKNTRFYQASSSEMYGTSPPPQSETTPFMPCSPYGVAKLAAYWITRTYRDAYGIFASNGVLFNHESDRRGETFVTKKIVRSAVRIKLGLESKLALGNLKAMRDWGHSRDYMRAIHMILQHDRPDDFVVATGEHYSVQFFLERVFDELGIDWRKYVVFEDRYTRPKEVPALLGDPSKIKQTLGWEPEININKLIEEMIESVMEEEAPKATNRRRAAPPPANYEVDL
jgi:GDPmannose 4,6-dehydratase